MENLTKPNIKNVLRSLGHNAIMDPGKQNIDKYPSGSWKPYKAREWIHLTGVSVPALFLFASPQFIQLSDTADRALNGERSAHG